jgi:hypothetical protein
MAQRPHNSHGVVVRVGNAANGVVYSVRLASTECVFFPSLQTDCVLLNLQATDGPCFIAAVSL